MLEEMFAQLRELELRHELSHMIVRIIDKTRYLVSLSDQVILSEFLIKELYFYQENIPIELRDIPEYLQSLRIKQIV